MTPNPETMKFVANKLLYPGKSIDFPDESSATPSPLAKELFSFPFIKSVFIASNFVTLTKATETDWNDVIPSIRQFLKEYLEDGKPVINEEEVAAMKQDKGAAIRRAVNALPEEHRTVVDLAYYHGRSVSEIGDILAIPVATVKTRMFYARKKLGEALKAAGYDRGWP